MSEIQLKRDNGYRNVKSIKVIDTQHFEVLVDLGFGIGRMLPIVVESPVLEALPNYDVLAPIFQQANVRVVVQQIGIVPMADPPSWKAELYVNDAPLAHVVSRVLAAREGEVAL